MGASIEYEHTNQSTHFLYY